MKRVLPLILFALTLSACGGVDYGGPFWGRGGGGSGYGAAPSAQVDGIAYGSRYASYLTASDTAFMSDAFLGAMYGEEGTRRPWSNGRTGASGEVVAGAPFLQNVDYARGRRLTAPPGLETRWALEPAQGDYTATATTNVRLGASTTSRIIDTLDQGMVVEAVGRVQNAPWMLVARHGDVIGYMNTDFLEQRAGGDVLLAGGTARQPVYCRTYQQSLATPSGQRDQWAGTACQDERGQWRVQGSRGPGM
jgi:surface antigen